MKILLHDLAEFCRRLTWEWHYFLLRGPKQRAYLPVDQVAIERRLREGPIPVEEFAVDAADWRRWLEKAAYENRYPTYYVHNRPEKSLEHYLAAKLLDLQGGAVYLDVASETGVAADIYQRVHGVDPLVQDLAFPPGIHGNRIGSNAANLPLEDASVDALGLHCSFEHFEGDADSAFVREMARVLKPGGKGVILPLYLYQQPACMTNPVVSGPVGTRFDDDAVVVAVKDWCNRHGRFYDPSTLEKRVWRHKGPLQMKVLALRGCREADRGCYVQYAAFFEKPS